MRPMCPLLPWIPALAACYVGVPDGGASETASPPSTNTSGTGPSPGTVSALSESDPTGSSTTREAPSTSATGETGGDPSSGSTSDAITGTTGEATTGAIDDAKTSTTGDATSNATGTTGGSSGPEVCTDSSPGQVTGEPDDDGTIASVCARWNNDLADGDSGPWCGDLDTCEVGDVATAGRTNALRVLNLYRWLADLAPVISDPTRDAGAQACALMMHANGQLSHTPMPAWECYSTGGAQAAAQSNIAATPGVSAVGLYMRDPGNATTFVHRRWILSNGLGPVGLGSTTTYSCMWVLGGNGKAGKSWTAWPPPGIVPLAAAAPAGTTAWTIQSESIPLAGAQVTVTEDGQPRPVTVQVLLPGYGSAHAISIDLEGWQVKAGSTYTVSVTGIGESIEYAFEVVDCS